MGRRFRILSEIKRFATASWAGSTLELDRKKSKPQSWGLSRFSTKPCKSRHTNSFLTYSDDYRAYR
jgi:hypothetical protein